MRQHLLYVLLNIINSIGYDKTTKEIAKKMLMDINFVQNSTLEECAAAYYVSVSTLNRFCRKIGMYNYSSLRDTLNQYNPDDENQSFYHLTEIDPNQLYSYLERIDTEVDYDTIVKYLKKARTIFYRGFDYHYTFLRFQQGMILQDKLVELWNLETKPYEVEKDDLIFIFTIKGRNLQNFYQTLEQYDCKKICVTALEDDSLQKYFDVVIHIPSTDQYDLQRIGKDRIINHILCNYKKTVQKLNSNTI